MDHYILGIDEGTTSARAVIYHCETDKIISHSASAIKQIYPQSGYVEQDAEQIYQCVVASAEQAIISAKLQPSDINAVALTNQRESVVAWDAKTGKPICNSICWQCRRTAPMIEQLKTAQKQKIKELTGLIPDAYFSASKMAWILQNIPKASELAKLGRLRMGTIDSFIAYKLTGNFVTDTTNASRTMLFNIHSLKWDDYLLKLWGIPKDCLPQVVSSDAVVGNVNIAGGAPLCSIIGDQQSSLFGQGCHKKGDTKVTFGTGGFALINIGKDTLDLPNLLTTIAYTIKGKTYYAIEGSIYSACSGIDWLKNGLGLYKDVTQTAKMAERIPDNGGVYFVPAFTGLGAPYWNSNVRGTITGISFATSQDHIIRAMLESMAYNTYDIISNISATAPIKRISVDGGGSKNTFLLQFLADITNTKVTKAVSSESTVLGAIKIAEMHLNIPKKEVIPNNRVYLPSMDNTIRKKYIGGWHKAIEMLTKGD